MTKIYLTTLALVFVSSIPAVAQPVSAEAKASIEKALVEIECTGADIQVKGDGYEAEDATCKDGQYDIILDKDFKIVIKEKD
jgi:hypothetical protein